MQAILTVGRSLTGIQMREVPKVVASTRARARDVRETQQLQRACVCVRAGETLSLPVRG